MQGSKVHVNSTCEKEKVILIGGVPEHFNYPFYLAAECKLYEKYNVKAKFVVKKCGTGAMIGWLLALLKI